MPNTPVPRVIIRQPTKENTGLYWKREQSPWAAGLWGFGILLVHGLHFGFQFSRSSWEESGLLFSLWSSEYVGTMSLHHCSADMILPRFSKYEFYCITRSLCCHRRPPHLMSVCCVWWIPPPRHVGLKSCFMLLMSAGHVNLTSKL